MRDVKTSATSRTASASERFLTPPRARVEGENIAMIATAHRAVLHVRERRIVTYRWGRGEKRAVLVHGWGGAATDLCSYVEPLVNRGYEVVAFDAPAHGASPGETTHVSEMADVLASIERFHKWDLVVAHSIGATITALAIARGLAADRLAFLAPAPGARLFAARFASAAELDAEAQRVFYEEIEQRVGVPFAELEIEAAASRLGGAALVVYDADDPVSPPRVVRRVIDALAAPRTLPTRGLGHFRILRDQTVVDAVLRFAA